MHKKQANVIFYAWGKTDDSRGISCLEGQGLCSLKLETARSLSWKQQGHNAPYRLCRSGELAQTLWQFDPGNRGSLAHRCIKKQASNIFYAWRKTDGSGGSRGMKAAGAWKQQGYESSRNMKAAGIWKQQGYDAHFGCIKGGDLHKICDSLTLEIGGAFGGTCTNAWSFDSQIRGSLRPTLKILTTPHCSRKVLYSPPRPPPTFVFWAQNTFFKGCLSKFALMRGYHPPPE